MNFYVLKRMFDKSYGRLFFGGGSADRYVGQAHIKNPVTKKSFSEHCVSFLKFLPFSNMKNKFLLYTNPIQKR